uniref:C-type lectin domain-containing protein n=2 Tax=Cyprinodon variegatus TaxID=28743 RepID=A0A3Q2DYK2_CYPVA
MVCQLYEYHYIKELKTWTEAQQYCREKHTDLATVSNMTDMKRLLCNSAGNMKEAWIGLYDQRDAKRTWHWSLPGVEFIESEKNWADDEPNNKGTDGQNCGIIWKSDLLSLKWGDISCNERYPFFCYNDNDTSNKLHFVREEKTWLKAQSYCREKYTDLVSGPKQLQKEHIKEGLTFGDIQQKYIFIGLFSDTWRWSDENSSSFRHWNLEFNNQIINSGQCAMVVFDDGGRWRNENCTVKKPFICYDESNVILIKQNKTWAEALSYCREHHHDLVTITSPTEQRSVQQSVKFASTPFVWMGLSYACTLDLWFWVSDEVVSYENWGQRGQMDECDMSGAMDAGGSHQWFKKMYTERFNFVCLEKRCR